MRLSVFTPTHKPDYLQDAYKSLQRQTFKNWEWILVPNGAAKIPEEIRQNAQVKIFASERLYNVGALKRFACDHASGDAFVELDHDDILVPSALEAVSKAFEQGAGFVYSDVAVFKQKKTAPTDYFPFTFAAAHGWQDYEVTYDSQKLKATKAFDITPRALSEIYYCPDHIRAWSRKAYYEAGGHNPDLAVCDDHELIIKTYLSGAPFMHAGGCQYLYRMFDQNTVVLRNKQIQETTQMLKEKYFNLLIASWLKRTGLTAFNLTEKFKEQRQLDCNLFSDISENSCGHIIADMELQRFEGSQVREFLNNAYKSLVPGGYLTITVPDVQSGMGYADVEWRSQFSALSMLPYTRKAAAKLNGNIRCRFQQISCREFYLSDWHKAHNFKLLRFELAALKGQRFPGLQHI